MIAHGEREHATWSASSTEANVACPGRLALVRRAPPDRENPAAAWGTACHQISERALRDPNLALSTLVGTFEQTKESSVAVDAEMVNCAQTYVDYVKQQAHDGTRFWVEERFALDDLAPPFDAGGTCDAIVYSLTRRSLEVIDLKAGRGVVVDVIGNAQLRTYALGAMLAHKGLDVDTVTVTIVQPRADHKDGRIRSETFHVADLIEWTCDLLAAMQASKRALDAIEGAPTAVWAAEHLYAGAHCKFCPAAATCPALRQKALDAAGVWFDDLDQPRLSNAPPPDDPAEIAKMLDVLDMINDWANAVRAHAHRLAETGAEIPGYQLVEKIGNRKWASETAAYDYLRGPLGLTAEEITVSKMKSPAQIESLLGAKRKGAIADLVTREVTGTNLVAAYKTTRAAAAPRAARMFDDLSAPN